MLPAAYPFRELYAASPWPRPRARIGPETPNALDRPIQIRRWRMPSALMQNSRFARSSGRVGLPEYEGNDGHDSNDGICFLDSPEISLGARRE